MNPSSPFTAAQWASVLDPDVNTWMASKIWSIGGWALWTTSEPSICNCQGVPGGAIPYPDGPVATVDNPPPPGESPPPPGNASVAVVVGGAMVAGAIIAVVKGMGRG